MSSGINNMDKKVTANTFSGSPSRRILYSFYSIHSINNANTYL